MIPPSPNRTSVHGAALLLAAVLLVPGHDTRVLAGGGPDSLEEALLSDIAAGNNRRCLGRLETMLADYPAHPVSVLHYPYLFQLADYVGAAAVDRVAVKTRSALLVSGEDRAGAALLRLQCGIEKLRYRSGGAAGKKVTDELMPVRKWSLLGPYRRYGPGDMDHRFQPEVMPDPLRVTPMTRATVANFDGWLEPGRHLPSSVGVVYALTSFYAEGGVKVRVCSDSAYRVFINGRPAARNDPGDLRNVRVIRVARASGVSVMLKLPAGPGARVRLLITDDRDRSINPVREDDRTFAGECAITEEPEFPGGEVMEDKTERGDLHRAMYFGGLGSGESLQWFRASIERDTTGQARYLLAQALEEEGRKGGDEARFEEAQRVINELRDRFPAHVPSRHLALCRHIEKGEYAAAYQEGRRSTAELPLDLRSCLGFMKVLDVLGRDTEFLETAALLKKEYPDSSLIASSEADFYSRRNATSYIAALEGVLKLEGSPERALAVVREHAARGYYDRALSLIGEFNYNRTLTGEQIRVLIMKGDYDGAKSVIFKSLVTGEDPELYHYLGMIDIAQYDDPSMYFQKLLKIDPSRFVIEDYLRYLATGALEPPFSGGGDVSGVEGRTPGTGRTSGAAEVLYRGRTIAVNEDGSGRTLYEELVRVNDESGVRRWSEVRLPAGGEFMPVRVRVYGSSGDYAGDFSLEEGEDGRVLRIGHVRAGTVVHLSYVLVNEYPHGGFLCRGPEFLQDYDERVTKASYTVIAPESMRLHFMTSRGIAVTEKRYGAMRRYSISASALAPVTSPAGPAGRQGILPFVAVSTLEGPGDFVAWYKGLLPRDTGVPAPVAEKLAETSVERTVRSVYDFVTREMALLEGGPGSPEPPRKTLFRKKGTAEDRVILARALLGRLGVRSYIACARNRMLDDPGRILPCGYYTDLLLYVPLDPRKGLWLDFSRGTRQCGVASESVTGATALVIVNDYYQMKKIAAGDTAPEQ